jgi:hypothetical protein
MLGQTTLPLVIAAYAALFFSTKLPWASGIAVAVATLKPTFGIPLILVMLSLRHYRPVVVGILISGAATLVPSMVLVRSAGGVVPLLRSIWEGYTSLSNESAASITRVDAVALIGRLSGDSPGPLLELGIFILVIAVAGAVMHHVRSRATGQGADLYCIAVASIAILISVYQLSYSALLLVMPITALFLNRWVPVEFEVNPIVRVVLIVLLLIPMVNYAASYGVAGRFESGSPIWLAVTSVNSIGVLLAFCIYVVVGSMRVSKPPSPIGPKSPDMSLG